MGILDLFRRSAPAVEKRSAGAGFTAEVMRFREAYISGRTGLAELSGTVSSCVSLWQNSLSLAKVAGTDMLGPCELALIGRSLALRGEFVALIDGDTLVPASDWDTRTRNSKPVAYRLSIPEAGGGRTETALAGEVVHVRINADPAAPWLGVSPLRTASLSAGMLHSVESALSEVYESMPFGSQVVPMPEAPETDNTNLQRSFKGQRGRVLLRESVVVTAAGGPAPQQDWRPSDLTPSLEKAVPIQALSAARESIAMAYGVLPALLDKATTGQLVKQAQQHLVQFTLQPVAELIATEASEKLASPVSLDVMTGTQAFDTGAAARSFQMLIAGLAAAKEAGIDAKAALAMLDWSSNEI
jgi:phage portal protein BeeE